MAFQSTVRTEQASGIPGEFAFDGPQRALSFITDSTDAANNVFGRAFTVKSETTAEAGGTGAFAGIMVGPKQQPSYGTAADGTLAPTLAIPNGLNADFCTMGMIYVTLTTTASVGDSVAFVNATGAIAAYDPGATIPGAATQILGAKVIRCDVNPAGLAIIQLTDQSVVNPT